MKKIIVIAIIWVQAAVSIQAQNAISLAGKWIVAIDSSAKASLLLPSTNHFSQLVQLPGTLDDAGIGYAPDVYTDTMNKAVMKNLWRKKRFVGTAWYKRDVVVPSSFQNKKMKLRLERVIWQTTVWVDGKQVGSAASLSAPQEFELPELAPGKHSIVLAIDNRQQYDIGDATHAYTDGTQIIWNGVIGKMLIVAKEQYIDAVKITSDIRSGNANFEIKLDDAELLKNDELKVAILYKGKAVVNKSVAVKSKTTELQLSIPYPKFWDEFSPNLYTAVVQLVNGPKVKDSYESKFGMRKLGNEQSLLHINGHRIFLRGTLECNIFPLTGHPPMEKKGWEKLMSTAKSYGLNHLRFHSWCPPEAAFAVADSLGLYLQVELPLWATISRRQDSLKSFLNKEAQLILKNYGNHPSFCFFSMGNELEGNFNWLNDLVKQLKTEDPRRLYTTTSFSFGQKSWPQPQDQYYISQWTTKGWVRGQGIFNDKPPRFNEDYRKSIDSIPVPIVTHEIGQYSVYPNMKEISKYTGVLAPLNFIAVKKDLEKKGLLPLANDFLMASGKLAASLYKEEIERALKTPGMSGFQLLDLHDFPGQSTALVGLLDAFWDNKGIISGKDFSRFCGPVVPLMRFEKAAYINNETFSGDVEVANFTNAPLKNSEVLWRITNATGAVLSSGSWKMGDIAVGNENKAGNLRYELKNIEHAEKLTINVQVKNTNYSNAWEVWVYPTVPEVKSTKVSFTTSLNEAISLLEQGKNVLLNPDTAALKGANGRYPTVFWSPVHFPDPSGTMGLLINNKSAAFAAFPTETYTNWQWWDMVKNSKSMVLDGLPIKEEPLVRVIDNFFRNRSLATIIEAKVGKGRLLLCSMNIHTNLDKRPAAAQLRSSLIKYMDGIFFKPANELTVQQLNELFRP